MGITKQEIIKWNAIIKNFNACNSEAEKEDYLQTEVEDVNLFKETLQEAKNYKPVKTKEKTRAKTACTERHNIYTQEEVMDIFRKNKNNIDVIVNEYSKRELTDMYLAIYSSRPLTASGKKRIAQNIHQYIYTLHRTEALLG